MITVNGRELNFETGMTVEDALKTAGEYADSMTLVIVNKVVLPCGQLHTELLSDGAQTKVLPVISGG